MSKKSVIAVVGANGKMGRILCEKLESKFEIIKITENNTLYDYKNIDLVIDFSNATQSVCSALFCKEFKIPIIIGATGHTKTQTDELFKASKTIPVLMSSNFSLGTLILKRIIEILKDYFSKVDLDITIIEKHHKEKKDLPSGTALYLAKEIKNLLNINPNILSERGGKEVGEHQIDVYFESELISISHKVFSRECFANGVVKCVAKMLKLKDVGLFNFEDFYIKI